MKQLPLPEIKTPRRSNSQSEEGVTTTKKEIDDEIVAHSENGTAKKTKSRHNTAKKSKILNADQDDNNVVDPMQADTVEIHNLTINSPQAAVANQLDH